MNDCAGRLLHLGDRVAYTSGSQSLDLGEIVLFTPKGCRIQKQNNNIGSTYKSDPVLKFSYQVCWMSSDPVRALELASALSKTKAPPTDI